MGLFRGKELVQTVKRSKKELEETKYLYPNPMKRINLNRSLCAVTLLATFSCALASGKQSIGIAMPLPLFDKDIEVIGSSAGTPFTDEGISTNDFVGFQYESPFTNSEQDSIVVDVSFGGREANFTKTGGPIVDVEGNNLGVGVRHYLTGYWGGPYLSGSLRTLLAPSITIYDPIAGTLVGEYSSPVQAIIGGGYKVALNQFVVDAQLGYATTLIGMEIDNINGIITAPTYTEEWTESGLEASVAIGFIF